MNTYIVLGIAFMVAISIAYAIFNSPGQRSRKSKAESIYSQLDALRPDKTMSELKFRDLAIRLDNLLAAGLQNRYGNTKPCGENLKAAKELFKREPYNSIWEYHKLRNQVVHEDYKPSYSDINQMYNIYDNALLKILNI